jgi:hypothetical protein
MVVSSKEWHWFTTLILVVFVEVENSPFRSLGIVKFNSPYSVLNVQDEEFLSLK